MTNQQILTKAIQKAIGGGWKPVTPDDATMTGGPLDSVERVVEYWDLDWREEPEAYYHIIFNHDFAKALWGENWLKGDGDATPDFAFPVLPPYKWHLQRMVLAEDPVKYLGENI